MPLKNLLVAALVFGLSVGWCVSVAAQEPVIVPPVIVEFAEAALPADASDHAPAEVDSVSVVLSITVGVDGLVSDVAIKTGAGEPFDTAALEACARFVFQPATADGAAIAVVVPYTYVFEIVRRTVVVEVPVIAEGVVQGEVLEAGTRRPLGGIMVLLEPQVELGEGEEPPNPLETVTDADGGYRFEQVPDGEYLVHPMAADGRQPTQVVTVEEGGTVDVPTLHAPAGRVSRYRTVVKAKPNRKTATKVSLEEAEIKTVPGTFGDPTRVIATLPGVARTAFGLPYYVVRGGGFENTGLLVDGFGVPLLYHLFSGPAVINPELIGSIDFYPGGFPVEYGRYTAGLIDVGTKDPDRDTWHIIAEVDVFKASLMATVPFDDGKGVIAFGARGSWIGAILTAFAPDTGLNLFYWDYQFRLTYDFDTDTSLTVTVLGAGDHILAKSTDDEPSFEDTGGGRAELAPMFHRATVRLTHQLSPSAYLRSDTLIGFDGQKFVAASPGSPEIRFESDGLMLGQRLALFVRSEDGHTVATGVDFEGFHLVGKLVFPGLEPLATYPQPTEKGDGTGEIRGTVRLDEWNTALWADFAFQVVPGVRVVPGLRLELFHINGFTHLTADPRLTVRADITDWLTVKASSGIFHQTAEPFQLDAVFGEPELGPLSAWQSSAGFELRFGEDDEWQIDLTGFYNQMYDLPIYSGDVGQEESDEGGDAKLSQASYTNEGRGRSYGLEFLFRKRVGEYMFGWLSYTLSRSERKPGELSAGFDPEGGEASIDGWGVFAMDQSHVLNVAWTFLLPWNMSAGARFTLATGRPGPRIVGAYYDVDADSYDPIVSGSERMPVFHQLDIRVDKRFVFKTWMIEVYIDIQNLYFQDNAEFYSYSFDYGSRSVVGGLPILPTLGFKAVF